MYKINWAAATTSTTSILTKGGLVFSKSLMPTLQTDACCSCRQPIIFRPFIQVLGVSPKSLPYYKTSTLQSFVIWMLELYSSLSRTHCSKWFTKCDKYFFMNSTTYTCTWWVHQVFLSDFPETFKQKDDLNFITHFGHKCEPV